MTNSLRATLCGLRSAAGPVAGAQDGLPRHGHPHPVGGDLQVGPGHPLPVADRAAQHADHLLVALDHGGGLVVVGRGGDAGEQLGHRGEHHVGLAQADGRTWLM